MEFFFVLFPKSQNRPFNLKESEIRPKEIFDKSDAEKAKELSEEVIKFCDEKIKEII